MQPKMIKGFDWRSLNKFVSPRAMGDLNAFLEKLPQNTSKSLLVITGIIWGVAAAIGLFTTVKMQELAELVSEREEAQALKPIVPRIRDKPVNATQFNSFVDNLQEIYKGLEIKGNGANIVVSAKSTAQFGQFREAIGHVQNGGAGWRVNVERLCVGKECGSKDALNASLRISTISVEKVSTR
ncbi:MAG: hypothetical protein ACRBDL_00335 [Alphaproteobacteria bacterium]